MSAIDEIRDRVSLVNHTPATYEELLAAVKGDAGPLIVESMVAEILIYRDAMATGGRR